MAGAASVATLPLAVYLTRFSDAYELLHASVAIPLAGVLGVVALALSRRARRQRVALLHDRRRSPWAARAGGALGIVGLCLVASAVVALAVYGLLEYVGSRE